MKFKDSIIILLSTLISFFWSGCTPDLKTNFPDDDLLAIYTENEGSPLMQPFIMVIPVEDKWIIFHNLHVYNFIYIPWKKENNNDNYAGFLKMVLKGEIKLKIKDIPTSGYAVVTENERIISEFKKNGFDYIKNKYLFEENGSLVLKTHLPDDEYNGLIKLMFYRGFCVLFDDYSGKLIFKQPINLSAGE